MNHTYYRILDLISSGKVAQNKVLYTSFKLISLAWTLNLNICMFLIRS